MFYYGNKNLIFVMFLSKFLEKETHLGNLSALSWNDDTAEDTLEYF